MRRHAGPDVLRDQGQDLVATRPLRWLRSGEPLLLLIDNGVHLLDEVRWRVHLLRFRCSRLVPADRPGEHLAPEKGYVGWQGA